MRKLCELSVEELQELRKKNNEFETLLYDLAYGDNMFWQEEWYRAIYGKDNKTIKCHCNYTSFYHTLEDAEHFVDSILDTDYFTKEIKELYDKTKELSDKWNNMDYEEQDEKEELYNELEDKSRELLDSIDDMLREFESVKEGDIEQQIEMITTNDRLVDYETDGEKVYQYITKVYK